MYYLLMRGNKKMKKLLSILTVLLALTVFTACGGNEKVTSEVDSNNDQATIEGDGSYEEMELKVGIVVGDWSPHYEAAKAWADELEAETDGKISLAIFPDGQVGGEREMMEAVQNGTLDIGLLSSVVYANFEPKMAVLDIPYLVSTFDEAEALMDSEVGEKLNELMLDKGIRNLAWAHNDFRIISNKQKPIENPEDLAGIKMRVPESKILADWFQKQGSLATPMPFPDIYTALQQGVVDGQDNGPILTFAANFYEHQKYLTVSNHQYSPVGFFISEKVWQTLPDNVQDLLAETALIAAEVEKEAIRNMNEHAIKSMEEAGVEVFYPEEEDLNKFKETTEPFIEQIREIAGDELTDFILEKAGY